MDFTDLGLTGFGGASVLAHTARLYWTGIGVVESL